MFSLFTSWLVPPIYITSSKLLIDQNRKYPLDSADSRVCYFRSRFMSNETNNLFLRFKTLKLVTSDSPAWCGQILQFWTLNDTVYIIRQAIIFSTCMLFLPYPGIMSINNQNMHINTIYKKCSPWQYIYFKGEHGFVQKRKVHCFFVQNWQSAKLYKIWENHTHFLKTNQCHLYFMTCWLPKDQVSFTSLKICGFRPKWKENNF